MVKTNSFLLILGIVVLLIIAGMLVQNRYDVFSTLPMGQNICSQDGKLITNVLTYNISYTNFANQYAWVSIDGNNDGIREHYGTVVTTTSDNSCSTYSTTRDLPIIFTSGNIQMRYSIGKIYICKLNYGNPATGWTLLKEGTGAAVNAVDTCLNNYEQPACNIGQTICDPSQGNNTYRNCQTNNQWSGTFICAAGQMCTNNACVAPGVIVPPCTNANWQSSISPTTCPSTGLQTRTWSKIGTCTGGISYPPTEMVTCIYNAPPCAYSYSNWGVCQSDGTQTRTTMNSPTGCNGQPVLSQTCIYTAPQTGTGTGSQDALVVCEETQFNFFGTCFSKTFFWIIVGVIVLLGIVMAVKK